MLLLRGAVRLLPARPAQTPWVVLLMLVSLRLPPWPIAQVARPLLRETVRLSLGTVPQTLLVLMLASQ